MQVSSRSPERKVKTEKKVSNAVEDPAANANGKLDATAGTAEASSSVSKKRSREEIGGGSEQETKKTKIDEVAASS